MPRALLVRTACAAVLMAVAVASGRSQEAPLPDLMPFLREARARARTDSELLSQYTYIERSADIHMSLLGKVTAGPIKVYQVYPGGERMRTYRKLIEVDGNPVPQAQQDKQDRERQKKVLEMIARRERESDRDRAKRLERDAQQHREEEQTLDDLFRVYDYTMVGRQTLDGRPVIAVDFAPKPNAAPVTDDGRLMKKVKGRVWISEDDYQIARVEALMLDDISRAGFLFKLYKGTTASFERRKVNDEVWLPSEMRLNGSGRALFRKFHIETVVQYLRLREVFSRDRHEVLAAEAEEAGPVTLVRPGVLPTRADFGLPALWS